MKSNDLDRLETLLRRTANSLIKTEEQLNAERAARAEPVAIAITPVGRFAP